MAKGAEAEREAVAQEVPAAPDEGDVAGDDVRGWPWWAIPVVILALAAVVIAVGRMVGVGPAILVLAATALLTVVGFLFRAVQSIAEPVDDEDARVAMPPTLAEEQKRAALRALKELEFEKNVGNISPDDYEEIVKRYREEAKRAMRVVDEERRVMRERAEKLARKAIAAEVGDDERVVDKSVNPFASKDEGGDEVPSKAALQGDIAGAVVHDNICPKCAVTNDDDARFCKGCGATLGDVA
jgi:hypothetical protein